MVWKKILRIITLGYLFSLFFVAIVLTISMGPGEIIYYSINGNWHPDIHSHTIYSEWIKLWIPFSLLSLSGLLFLHFLTPKDSPKPADNFFREG